MIGRNMNEPKESSQPSRFVIPCKSELISLLTEKIEVVSWPVTFGGRQALHVTAVSRSFIFFVTWVLH